jgi:hypothetical protein
VRRPPADQKPDPAIGTLVAGRYRIRALLGEGGMGQVYQAEHEAIEKQVALKILRPEYSRKPDIVTRFQQEAISASRIKHPNVLDVFDFGQTNDGCFFLAMELLEGIDLADDLVLSHVIEPVRGMRIASQVCKALAAAHERGVVHRDLKPENVFLQRTPDGDEVVKIVDFGIAQLRSNEEAAASEPKRRRLTRTGMIFGTPEYMAPEQAAGKKADLRVDIYALGVILYEMFTGAVPFTGESFMEVLAGHLNDPPPEMHTVYPGLAISPEFQSVIMQTLVKDPDGRFQSMSELVGALACCPEGALAGLAGHTGNIPHVSAINFVPLGAERPAPHPSPVAVGSPTALLGAGTTAQSLSTREARTVAAVDPTRASTQLGAETASAPAARRSSLGLFLAGAALLATAAAVAAIAAVMLLRDRAIAPVPPPPVAVSAPRASVARPTAPNPAQPAPSASAEATTVTPTMRVRLDVHTVPEGAVLFKDGAQVCDRTPCEVLADPDETLELEARKGVARGKLKVLAQNEQKVTITLVAAPPVPRAQPTRETAAPRICERFDPVLGIKIAVPCP